MTQKEEILYLWGGSWLVFTWGSFFVVMAHRAIMRRVYHRKRCRTSSRRLP